ncbi:MULTISPECIES: hypothetical protein [unclassified Meiothermus]|uniref:hypothetical protein n=1 Tax=unclassified Meiothermus TaxID=370471 RepID=UPI000D7CE8A0|nr:MULTISPECIES: hypothetical protein [unclassified Meiothermus]PZA07753.1 hypothetical protein DNA98_05455 [Meiothermus sp. Pnk-1]RYM38947.1 hypothetical protein EWH23_04240 [Meiothermus sp. PNK-Is4]
MADFGTDIGAITQQGFTILSGADNLAAALLRRLITPRGGLFYDPTYGFDLREYVGAAVGPQEVYEIEQLAAAECEKDPRVLSATATVLNPDLLAQRSLNLRLEVETDGGPFALILAVDQVRVEVLRA